MARVLPEIFDDERRRKRVDEGNPLNSTPGVEVFAQNRGDLTDLRRRPYLRVVIGKAVIPDAANRFQDYLRCQRQHGEEVDEPRYTSRFVSMT